MKLFVIGNGFDLSHELPTKYSDFKNFLEKQYDCEDSFDPIIPEKYDGYDGEEYDDKEVAQFVYWLVSNADRSKEQNWSDLEESLGKLNLEAPLYDFQIDWEDDRHLERQRDALYEAAESLVVPTLWFNQLFTEWIDTINLETCNPNEYDNLIDSDDLFLSFNYTKTLEEVYGISSERVCHIHGKIGESDLIIGHSDKPKSPDYEEGWDPISDAYETIKLRLYKDTKKIIEKHSKFFDTISNCEITNTIVVGHSYGKVDHNYFKKLMQALPNSEWVFQTYEEDTQKRLENMLKKLNFNDSYSVVKNLKEITKSKQE